MEHINAITTNNGYNNDIKRYYKKHKRKNPLLVEIPPQLRTKYGQNSLISAVISETLLKYPKVLD
jgi:hypothetical protein